MNTPKEGLFNIIEKYTHPINYKIMDWKEKIHMKIKNKEVG